MEGAISAPYGFFLFLALMALAFGYIEVTRKQDAPKSEPEKKS